MLGVGVGHLNNAITATYFRYRNGLCISQHQFLDTDDTDLIADQRLDQWWG